MTCEVGRANPPLAAGGRVRSSPRERKRKRRDSECYSEDSAVEMDLDSGSDAEYVSGSVRAKRFKRSGTTRVAKRETGGGGSRTAAMMDDLSSWAIREGEKLLLRQWLQKQADDQTIPGLHWCDQQKTQIRIPWKHGSRTGWTIDDCSVYRAWAMHTGKIACITEPKKWKANFRCALNSLPDVRELKDLSQKKGGDPYKVYLMLPEVPRKSLSKKNKQCKLERIEDEPEDICPIPSPAKNELVHQLSEIKIKEEENVSDFKTTTENSGWSHDVNFDVNEIDTKTQHMHSLIPTVVEELSEEPVTINPVLTNLHAVGPVINYPSNCTQQPESPASSTSSLPSSSSSPSCNSFSDDSICLSGSYVEDISLFPDLLDSKLEAFFNYPEEFEMLDNLRSLPEIYMFYEMD